eukprot:TRINITY_DN11804_c0_g3_i1.p1 TRINITY_DN11804_c0_g3~~TRINITY_DN11804_c0_g3_i1.p1  ORF type:complete len:642 (-),score=86.20 TRINITY_DN11804_c0_g3_i1:29-1954(-)
MSADEEQGTPASGIYTGLEECLHQHQEELLLRLTTWMEVQQAKLDVSLRRMQTLSEGWVTQRLPEEDGLVINSWSSHCAAQSEAPSVQSRATAASCDDEADIKATEVHATVSVSSLPKFVRLSSYAGYAKARQKDDHDATSGATLPVQKVDSWTMQKVDSCRAWLRMIMTSWLFEMLLAATILANAIIMGAEVQYAAAGLRNPEAEKRSFGFVSTFFTVFFTLELLLRVWAFGAALWFSRWHYLDLLVVLASIADTVLAGSQNGSNVNSSSSVRMLRFARISRLIKTLRLSRAVRLIGALRSLVDSILGTLKSLMWSLLLLMLLMYSFSLIFAEAAISHLTLHLDKRPWEGESAEAVLAHHFGDIPLSMDTLFRAVSNGISWAEAANALEEVDPAWSYLFSFYIFIVLFAVINVLTAVFCQAAVDQANRDQESRVKMVLSKREFYLDGLKSLFRTVDADGNGKITLVELESNFNSPLLRALFEALDIDAVDAWELFQALDVDGDLTIDVDEFVDGCMLFRRRASALDIVSLKRQLDKARHQIFTVEKKQDIARATLQSVGIRHLSNTRTAFKNTSASTETLQPVEGDYAPADVDCSTAKPAQQPNDADPVERQLSKRIEQLCSDHVLKMYTDDLRESFAHG